MNNKLFHAVDGYCFGRDKDGQVYVHHDGCMLFNLDPASWASVVAFVSAANNPERYRAALLFHQGRDHGHTRIDLINDVHPRETVLAASLERIRSEVIEALTFNPSQRPPEQGGDR